MVRITKEDLDQIDRSNDLKPTFDDKGNLSSLTAVYEPSSEQIWGSWQIVLDPENRKAYVERKATLRYPDKNSQKTDAEFQDWLDNTVDAILEHGGYLAGWKCSFCYKTDKKVSKLIAGPGVSVCNECVLKLKEIAADTSEEEPAIG